MTIISFKERQERIVARAAERQAGELTDATFRASLFALGMRGDDIAMEARHCAPAPPYDHEEARYDASLAWMERYLNSADRP
jgi:molecular chaperone DnaK (HSP70)